MQLLTSETESVPKDQAARPSPPTHSFLFGFGNP